MKVCVFDRDWYLSSFRLAAPSAALPADEDVVSRYDSARVSVTVIIIIIIIIIQNFRFSFPNSSLIDLKRVSDIIQLVQLICVIAGS